MSKSELKGVQDIDIIKQYLKSRSTAHFKVLYYRYLDKVTAKCISLLKDETLAQDAVQDIFLKIYLNLPKFSSKSTFSTWVYSITYNHCIDFLRRKKKERFLISYDLDIISEIFADTDAEAQFDPPSEITVKEILRYLTENEKAILLMKYIENMSILEISEALDRSQSAIKMRLKRARTKARNMYQNDN